MAPESRILLSLLLLLARAGKWTALFLSSRCSPSTNQPTAVPKIHCHSFPSYYPVWLLRPLMGLEYNLQFGVETKSNLDCSISERENCINFSSSHCKRCCIGIWVPQKFWSILGWEVRYDSEWIHTRGVYWEIMNPKGSWFVKLRYSYQPHIYIFFFSQRMAPEYWVYEGVRKKINIHCRCAFKKKCLYADCVL
jgi:hypothetical protein